MTRVLAAVPALVFLLVGCGVAGPPATSHQAPAPSPAAAFIGRGSNAAADLSGVADRPTAHGEGQRARVAAQPKTRIPARPVTVTQDSGGLAGCGTVINTSGRAKIMCAPG